MAKIAKMDFSGLKKFQKNLQKLNEKARSEFTEAALKGLAARLLSKVVKATPVGYYKGGEYICTMDGRPHESAAAEGKQGGTLRRGWTVGEITKNGGAYIIEISNNVEYAPYVEYGHRTAKGTGWVDGHFMLTVSENELQKDAPGYLGRALERFVREAVNGK
jgi:hypothetical protein